VDTSIDSGLLNILLQTRKGGEMAVGKRGLGGVVVVPVGLDDDINFVGSQCEAHDFGSCSAVRAVSAWEFGVLRSVQFGGPA